MNLLPGEEKALLLDEFSGHVRRDFPPEVWRSSFQERTAVPPDPAAEMSTFAGLGLTA